MKVEKQEHNHSDDEEEEFEIQVDESNGTVHETEPIPYEIQLLGHIYFEFD
jgi:hypothetical protein